MFLTGKRGIRRREVHPGRALALVPALMLSGLLTAASLRSPDFAWLAWISLLPLFQAIRSGRLLPAVLAGGFWGACLYGFSVFSFGDSTPVIFHPSFASAALLTAVPAVYAGLGALLTRTIGFNPLVLALGWVLVEVAFKPLGIHQGLLAGTQTEVTLLHWLARLLGYVFVAFLVAGANASLLAVLSRARLSLPWQPSLARMAPSEARSSSQTSVYVQLLSLPQAYPRAPPISVVITS